jgi:hypothetical protein
MTDLSPYEALRRKVMSEAFRHPYPQERKARADLDDAQEALSRARMIHEYMSHLNDLAAVLVVTGGLSSSEGTAVATLMNALAQRLATS